MATVRDPDEGNVVEAADAAVARAAGPLRDHPVVKAAHALAEVADQPPLIALSVATLAFGLWRRDERLAAMGGRMLASHLLATAIKGLLKRAIDRTRPHVLTQEGRYRRGRGHHDEPRYNSFPSGHVAGGLAVARAVARVDPGLAGPAYGAVAAVAAAQIPYCAHYPSDLAAGALVGWGAEAAVDAAIAAAPAFRARR